MSSKLVTFRCCYCQKPCYGEFAPLYCVDCKKHHSFVKVYPKAQKPFETNKQAVDYWATRDHYQRGVN